MKLVELAEKAAALPRFIKFDFAGPERFHPEVFAREVRDLPSAIAYIDRLRARMEEHSNAIMELADAYEKMRELLLAFEVNR